MNRNIKKTISCLSLTVMAALSLTGCSAAGNQPNSTNTDSAANTAKGRFVEQELTLPFEKDYDAVLRLDENQHPYLIHKEVKEHTAIFTKYTLNDDESWTDSTLATIKLKGIKDIYSVNYFTGPKDEVYLSFMSGGEENKQYFYQQDGDDWKEVTFEGWNKKNEEYNFYITPSAIGILSDGSVIAELDGSINIYDPKTGKLTKTLDSIDTSVVTTFSFYGDDIVATQMDQTTYQPKNYIIYHTKDDTKEEIPLPDTKDIDFSSNIFLQDDTIYLVNNDGIQLYQKGGSKWQVVVDGCLTSLYLPFVGVHSSYVTKDQTYYVFCDFSDDVHLLKYTFDETVSAVPDKELSIYSLKDNPLVRQAIVTFQQTHPDVKVSLHAVSSPEDTTSTADYIRSLNTTLLAGEGDDLLVLDGLPYQSYQQKGVLADLSDIIKPLADDGNILPNVLDSFQVDGSFYYAPTRISPVIVYGNEDSGTTCTSLESMIQYADTHKDRPIIGNLSSKQIIDTFLPPYLDSIRQKDGKISEDGLRTFLEQLQKLYDVTGGISSTANPEEAQNAYASIYSLPSEMTCLVSESEGYMMDTFNHAVIDFVQGSIGNFENSYYASGIVGINNATKQMDLAKEFVALLFDEKIQCKDFLDGNPVNPKALENYYNQTYEGAETEIEDKNGNYVPFKIDQPTKEELKQIIDICKSTSHYIEEDATLIEKISTATEDMLAGKTSLDDTVKNLVKELSLYTEE